VSADEAQLPSSNPRALLCDTDAATQLLLAGDVSALRHLKRVYGIQPAIVEAVEFELRSPQSLSLRKLVAKYEPALDKAINNATIQILDERSLPAYVGHSANAVWTEVAIRATKWARRVQRGEAYSHSMALSLGIPLVTHDLSAIKILEKDGEALTTPLLRVFDLYAFGFQCGCMTEDQCDSCRKSLLQLNEFIPRAFQHRSFREGLEQFYIRLQCASKAALGHTDPIEPHDHRLVIRPMQSNPAQQGA